MSFLLKLRSLEILRSDARISSVDIFRAFAILPVVLYHFDDFLPYGYLGVDLFFVISGLLVGSILIRQYKRNEKINFFQFILRRGFKIWPSYYFFLIAGSIFVYLVYRNDRPAYAIENVHDSLRYVFFYVNYTDEPYHWVFDHSWSLCVEEHFYILLPLLLILVQLCFPRAHKMLLISTVGLILAGILFKILGHYFTWIYTNSSVTHSRIDALGWGVLLGILVTYYEEQLRKMKWLPVFFIVGLAGFATAIFVHHEWRNVFYEQAIFQSVTPFCFFLMLLGLYYVDFSKWKPLRFISYYSYNWYLWHPMLAWLVIKNFGNGAPGLMIYLVLSFLTAIIFTILIEERFLKIREAVLNRISKKTTRAAA